MHKTKKGATDVSFSLNWVGEHKNECCSLCWLLHQSVAAGSSSIENRKNEKILLHIAVARPGFLQLIFLERSSLNRGWAGVGSADGSEFSLRLSLQNGKLWKTQIQRQKSPWLKPSAA